MPGSIPGLNKSGRTERHIPCFPRKNTALPGTISLRWKLTLQWKFSMDQSIIWWALTYHSYLHLILQESGVRILLALLYWDHGLHYLWILDWIGIPCKTRTDVSFVLTRWVLGPLCMIYGLELEIFEERTKSIISRKFGKLFVLHKFVIFLTFIFDKFVI